MKLRIISNHFLSVYARRRLSQDDDEGSDNNDDDGADNEDGNQNDEEDENHAVNEYGAPQGRNRRSQAVHVSGNGSVKFALSFKDVEESTRPLSGDDDYPVGRWINDFEEASLLFVWDDLRMLIFAKKSLKELARTFIQGEKAIRSWQQLKTSLEDEFSSRLNSADLHQLLSERKMKKDE